ncbi:hypothetical protein DXG03_001883 [Asterophora parasitica]|uniref:Uncharacterized protein n=1 Tax=Asterophora parasitica TaxID=117018 RepID=A0A9P7G9D9_9AGAR|nr:hypothetical protein DXG03_001883 [Asterophora parasitica]
MSDIFYPDNRARADRLRGLFDQIRVFQKDIKVDAERLEEFGKQARDIGKSLGGVGLESLDSVTKAISVSTEVPALRLNVTTSTDFFGLFGGAEQKEKLIAGIHDAQIARLVTAAVRQSIRQTVDESRLLQVYLSILAKGQSPSAAQAIGEEITNHIREGQARIDLASLAAELEHMDQQSGAYDADDISREKVIALAEEQLQK